jgi:arginyl-tRNA--protein-N-Asp/Glu arginylyltransferase
VIKVKFNHIEGFGKVSQEDFIYSDPKGVALDTTYLRYLEEGWVEWGDYWYNLRSVRLRLAEYQPTKTVRKLSKQVDYSLHFVSDEILKVLQPIYLKYVERHGFKRDINLCDFKGFECILYYQDSKVIGANIFKLYRDQTGRAFVSYQFLWDYENPKLSLGNVSQFYECKVAQFFQCKHLYLLGGYESSSSYKADFKGFEWWTGEEWSPDKELYLTLCKRDDNIRTPQ